MRLEIPRDLLTPATAAPAAVSGPPALQAAARLPTLVSPRPSASGSAAATDPLEIALPLAKYASLCAELALFPHEAEAIFRRYGLERVEERAAVDAEGAVPSGSEAVRHVGGDVPALHRLVEAAHARGSMIRRTQ